MAKRMLDLLQDYEYDDLIVADGGLDEYDLE